MRLSLRSLILVAVLAATATAQTFRGAIHGSVEDPTGGVVANAQVKAIDVATGVEHATVTTSGGEFTFQDIPLGTYQVNVVASGFSKATVDKVPVTAGSVYTMTVKLGMGTEATTVEVSAAALTVDTTTPTQTLTISGGSVQNTPLNGRDFSQLISISPGYGGYSVGGFGSLNGTRANQMNWQIDGTDNNDFWHNIPAVNQGGVSGIAGVIMPIDAVQDFSSQTQSNAENGRNAGGVVNVVVKSGTNQIHGSAYYYNRNDYYAATSPFFIATPEHPKSPPLTNQNVGGVIGGPIIKNKLFWFTGFEYQTYKLGLTGLSTEPSIPWVNQAMDLLNNPGGKYGSYASVTPNTLSTTLLQTLWPSSIRNLPATLNNYFATVPGTGYSYNGVAKIDWTINDKNTLSGRWFIGQGSQTQPPGASLALATASSNLGYYFEVAPIHVQNYNIVWNSVLTPTLTNQVLAGVSYFQQSFHDANNTFDTKALGLYLSPDALINGNPIFGAPNIQISGFDQVGITPPEGRQDITGQIADILSWSKSKHQFRFGGEFRTGHVDEYYYRRSLGKFAFDGTQGDGLVNKVGTAWASPDSTVCNATCQAVDSNTRALADYLAGSVSTSSIAVGHAERKVVSNGFNFFAQDNWQITRNLNLTLGLRYEYFGPLHNGNKDLAVWIPGQGFKIQGADIGSIFPADHNNFAPRVGFAWNPTGRGDMVLRGGFGVFYDQINMNPFLDFRPPIDAADGLQDNPVGPNPVSNYSLNNYQWVSGQYIFPGVVRCPTLNGCNHTFNVYSVNQNFRTPYFYNYNLQLQKGIGDNLVFEMGYVGSTARKLGVMLNLNQNGTLNAAYSDIGSALQLNSNGTSQYNSMQVSMRMNAWHGLTGQFSYTWAHAIDQVTEYRGVIPFDSFNIALDKGNSDFDTRQLFVGIVTWTIPGSSKGPKILTHGWQVAGNVNFHTGQPFNPAACGPATLIVGGTTVPCIGSSVTYNTLTGTQRPGVDLVCDPFVGLSHTFSAAAGGTQWVNPNCFAPAANGIGNLTRNRFYGPGFSDVDISVLKNIPIKERLTIQLRAEMFNIFNRINLASGAGSVGSNGFVSDTIGDFNGSPGIGPGEPFNMQLVGKIIF